jgi:hypothetical protein
MSLPGSLRFNDGDVSWEAVQGFSRAFRRSALRNPFEHMAKSSRHNVDYFTGQGARLRLVQQPD